MKKLLVLLFSAFILSSPSVFADDISDFEIEGMSIGDSLLDYMTEDEILTEIQKNSGGYTFLSEPDKFNEVYLWENLSVYKGGLSIFVKNNQSNQYITNKNEKYTILSIRGLINYIEDLDSCIQKRSEIDEIMSKNFANAKKLEFTYSHSADPSEKSIKYDIYFRFNSGDEIELSCTNFDETFRKKMNWSEGLSVALDSKEIITWLQNKK